MIRNNGVSLIVLIITIIIMIILATAIIISLKDTNIIDKAKEAKNNYTYKQDLETAKLAVQELELDINTNKINNYTKSYVDLDLLEERMEATGRYSTYSKVGDIDIEGKGFILNTVNNHEIPLNEIWSPRVELTLTEAKDLGWNIDENNYWEYNGAGGTIVIPYIINGKKCPIITNVSLDSMCITMSNETIGKVTRVIWSAGYEEVYNLKVNQLSEVKEIFLPNTIKEISRMAFINYAKLETINIPRSVKKIGGVSFGSCKKLSEVILNEGLQTIATEAFAGCSELKSITIPYGVTTIEYMAFYHAGLTDITLPYGITRISNNTFDTSTLNSIVLPGSITLISGGAFNECPRLTNITVGSETVKNLVIESGYTNEDNIHIDESINQNR